MKICDVAAKIESYHPELPDYHGCDGYKSGDPQQECTGAACALVPTIDELCGGQIPVHYVHTGELWNHQLIRS